MRLLMFSEMDIFFLAFSFVLYVTKEKRGNERWGRYSLKWQIKAFLEKCIALKIIVYKALKQQKC